MTDGMKQICKVESVQRKETKQGHPRADVQLTVYGEDGLQDAAALDASVGPYASWMIPQLEAMAGTDDQYAVTVKQNDKWWNIVAIDGVDAPADWQDQLKKMGLNSNAGNGQSAGKPSGQQDQRLNTRLNIVAALSKMVMVKTEADWDNWCWKIEEYLYKGKRQVIASRPTS